MVVIGGVKVADKIGVIDRFTAAGRHDPDRRRDGVHVPGGRGRRASAPRGTRTRTARRSPARRWPTRRERGCELLLPCDVVVADRFADDAATRVVAVDAIPDGWMGLDIGPRTAQLYAERLAGARTIFWNGPMGVFEMEPFAAGTLARRATPWPTPAAVSVVGGGDSVAAVNVAGVADQITHVSTGGGAALELVEGQRAARRGGAGEDRRHEPRRPFVAGNWKMHKTASRGRRRSCASWPDALPEGVDVAVCVPFTVAGDGGRSAPRGIPLRVFAQNMHQAAAGRLHRRDLGGDAARPRRATACCSATPSGASTSARPTPRWPRS